jgi:transcriptional regulator with XRE-family HTH domain
LVQGHLFPALLKYWRGKRGLSQLDLATEAEVSSRHLSFLESGRAKPSPEMVLRLFSVLRAPLRAQNQALRAAGFSPHYPEPGLDALPPAIGAALQQMLAEHEPYPLTVVGLDGRILQANTAARVLFGAFLRDPNKLPDPPDMISLTFDPDLMRPFLSNWEEVAHGMVARLHREHLERPEDPRLADALARALAYPGVPNVWRRPDLSQEISPALTVRLQREALQVGFLVTVTIFSAPQQVTLDELRIESCYPLDEVTRAWCRQQIAPGSFEGPPKEGR